MKIGIGNDHSALELKAEIIEFLRAAIIRFMGNSWQGLWQQARWIRES